MIENGDLWYLVDIGNRRTKIAAIKPAIWQGHDPLDVSLWELGDTWPFSNDQHRSESGTWWISSVNRDQARHLVHWLNDHRRDDTIHQLSANDFPFDFQVDSPQEVGIDRLAAAAGAASGCPHDHALIVIDVGTAVTVDRISPIRSNERRTFEGGAIFCGPQLAAEALEQGTDALQNVTQIDDSPEPIGRNTQSAMASGLFWSLIGGVRELVARQSDVGPVQVVVTGGVGAMVASALGSGIRFEPNLVLQGIAQTGIFIQSPEIDA